jgi:hypothetical protein
MKISTILDHIDSGHMALPEFQRGFVWNRDQVRGLMRSLYMRYPVGGLLVWVTESLNAPARGDVDLAPGVVNLILDGQQRITSLYGIIRGGAPQFFDGREDAFIGLYFNLESEDFNFYSPLRMEREPHWIDVSKLMTDGPGSVMQGLFDAGVENVQLETYLTRIQALHGIQEVDLHVEEVAGKDKNIEVVVDIFNRVNSGGTKLSKGDLALAKICASSPDAREEMKHTLNLWQKRDYNFTLDWFLRSINTITTGEAKFEQMHDLSPEQFADGQKRATRSIDFALNLIAGRLGLDHDRVLFGRYAIPVMVNYIDRRGGHISDAEERDRLLFWYVQSAMWGRFSGSTESFLDRDFELASDLDNALDNLIGELKVWRGALDIGPENFSGWSLGARFYPVLYMLTRTGQARDWGTGLPLREGLLGKMSQLEVHHIFPKAVLYANGFDRAQVNAVANYCLLTKDTNLQISAREPEEYFQEIDKSYPGALESQWIPADRELWKVENYLEFLAARRILLAQQGNELLSDLLHSKLETSDVVSESDESVSVDIVGGIDGADEEILIEEANGWITAQGLPRGEVSFELADVSGRAVAVLDVAWPDGLQPGLSQPVALLINENGETAARANRQGYRCFSSLDQMKDYVESEVLVVLDVTP